MFLVRYQEKDIQSIVVEYTDQKGLTLLQEKEKDGHITILHNQPVRQAMPIFFYPNSTSKIIINTNPTPKEMVPRLE